MKIGSGTVEGYGMTQAVQQLLYTFDALADAEKHEAAAHLLRRVVEAESGDVPEESLVATAEGLFLERYARETADDRT